MTIQSFDTLILAINIRRFPKKPAVIHTCNANDSQEKKRKRK